MLTVVTPAADLGLLTLDETKAATGVTGSAQDPALETLRLRVAAIVAAECNVAAAGARAVTLRQETLREVLRPGRPTTRLLLSRRPVVSVASITVDGVALAETDYELDQAGAILCRLVDDTPAAWLPGKIVVEYVAGWGSVPDGLKLAAAKMSLLIWSENGPAPRDPSIKRERVDGVGEIERWVGPDTDPAFPQEVKDLLRPYRNGRRWS
jgi:hypothetical protein